MANPSELSKFQIDALREIASIGAGNAVTALSQFLSKKIEMTPPEVMALDAQAVCRIIAEKSPLLTIVAFEVIGEISGQMLVIFDSADVPPLIDLLLGKQPGTTAAALSEIDISAFNEVGSVMSASYLRVLGDMINITLRMSPPYFNAGSTAAIHDFLAQHSIREGETTICLTSVFYVADREKISGHLLFIPTASSLGILLKLLGIENTGL
jgi:chemotaxis protein CheC